MELQRTTNIEAKSSTLPYTLFLYREEMRRYDPEHLRLKKAKIILTDELIANVVDNLKVCSLDDLRTISREMMFKKRLKRVVLQMQLQLKLAKHDDAHPKVKAETMEE